MHPEFVFASKRATWRSRIGSGAFDSMAYNPNPHTSSEGESCRVRGRFSVALKGLKVNTPILWIKQQMHAVGISAWTRCWVQPATKSTGKQTPDVHNRWISWANHWDTSQTQPLKKKIRDKKDTYYTLCFFSQWEKTHAEVQGFPCHFNWEKLAM